MRHIKHFSSEEFTSLPSNPLNQVYKIRQTVRGIFFNSNKEIGCLYSSKYDFYELPGGGIEDGEDIGTALKREMQEELGYEVEIGGELGITTEQRDIDEKFDTGLFQISYYFWGGVKEFVGSHMTDGEIAEGMEVLWMSLDSLQKKMDITDPKRKYENYIMEREKYILNFYSENYD